VRARGVWARAIAGLIFVAIVGWSTAGQAADDKVRLQLKWVPQAQFAGYYAAQAKGLYAAERLDVTLLPGGPEIAASKVVAEGKAEVGIDWLPAMLAARDQGAPLVNIAQIFAYSGLRQVAFKSSGIKSPRDLRGHRVAVWFSGNEYPLFATLAKYKIDRKRDLTLVPQTSEMSQFLERKVDAASVTTYNEYRLLLEAGVKPEDLLVIDFNAEGTAMLEDGMLARADWLADAANADVAARLLRASLKGWELCQRRPAECVDIVLAQSPALDREHQTWMMTEVNRLIWGPPDPKGRLGRMDPAAFARTAKIALTFGVIRKPAEPVAYTHKIWERATAK
jgi:NitT/TauT family transport system substrate-binding protein